MKVTQGGLQDCFKRAYNAVYNSYLTTAMLAAGTNVATDLMKQAAMAQTQNAVMSQSYLRLETLLTNTLTNYTFPILNNQTNGVAIRPTEVRLAQQDSFFCSSIAVYLAKAASATDSAFGLKTYNSASIFTTGAASLFAFYNGFIKVNINKSVIIPNLALSNFYQVPQTQQTAATNSPIDEFDPSEVNLFEPNINFVGTKSSDITAILPSNIATIDANTYAVIVLQGILAQNVTLMS